MITARSPCSYLDAQAQSRDAQCRSHRVMHPAALSMQYPYGFRKSTCWQVGLNSAMPYSQVHKPGFVKSLSQ